LPTAYLFGRLKNINIFDIGSGNMGATNVVRAVGFGWGLSVWFCDVLKGMAAILVARHIMSESTASATSIAAIVAIIGHNWSLFATLLTATMQNGKIRLIVRGGKGAATAFGTLLMVAPVQVIVVITVIGGLIVATTRYVSLGVLVTFGLGITWMLILISQHRLEQEFAFYSVMMAALILVRFRGNIQRLLEGSERRLGETA
jgi:glycerol-3-phosphate acyltransferase PlsY